jgi:hypothetical protein
MIRKKSIRCKNSITETISIVNTVSEVLPFKRKQVLIFNLKLHHLGQGTKGRTKKLDVHNLRIFVLSYNVRLGNA